MRQIKASEVKPGMEVQWTHAGVTRKCVAETVDSASPRYGVNLHTSEGGLVHIPKDPEVTVLSEPAPAQPEEPTEFGAKVVAGGATALRTQDGADEVDPDEGPWRVRSGCNTWDDMTWAEVCALGPVTVVPDQGWIAPADAPEVPERIEEWPEDDTALRPYQWEDIDGCPWRSFGEDDWRFKTWEGGWSYPPRPTPLDGPWTRDADA